MVLCGAESFPVDMVVRGRIVPILFCGVATLAVFSLLWFNIFLRSDLDSDGDTTQSSDFDSPKSDAMPRHPTAPISPEVRSALWDVEAWRKNAGRGRAEDEASYGPIFGEMTPNPFWFGADFRSVYVRRREFSSVEDMSEDDKQASYTNFSFNAWWSDSLPLARPIEYDTTTPKGEDACAGLMRESAVEPDESPEKNLIWEPQRLGARVLREPANDLSRTEEWNVLAASDGKPKVVVVMIFYNELLSALLRSVVSVLNRTPDYLLDELILVDDCSDLSVNPDLGGTLEKFVQYETKKTRLLRLRERSGLMRARVAGARAARKGRYLVFLDSHVEVTPNWLEPLLLRLLQHPRHVATFRIDVLNHETLVYQQGKGSLGVLGFTWQMTQRELPKRKVGIRVWNKRWEHTAHMHETAGTGVLHNTTLNSTTRTLVLALSTIAT